MNQKTLYVGIDVSKEKLDVSLTFDGRSIYASKSFSNNSCSFLNLTDWVKKQSRKVYCEKIHVCLESTGIYSEEIADYLQDQENTKVSVMNPSQIKAYGKSIMLRTKTDEVDAKLIAFFAYQVKPLERTKTQISLKEFRRLVRHLDYLIRRRADEKGHLETVKSAMILDSVNKIIASYDQQIDEINKIIKNHTERDEMLKRKIELLETIPGIGEATAQIILSELQIESGNDNISTKSQTAHAGLAPSQKISGSSVRGKSKICKTGNRRLRKCLYLPAMAAIRYNIVIGDFYKRLLEKGKPKKVALIAAMRKLLVIAIGVLNNQTPFDPLWNEKNRVNINKIS